MNYFNENDFQGRRNWLLWSNISVYYILRKKVTESVLKEVKCLVRQKEPLPFTCYYNLNNQCYLCSTVQIVCVFLQVVFVPFISSIIQFTSVSLRFTSPHQIIACTVVFHVTQRITEVFYHGIINSYHVIQETFVLGCVFGSKFQVTTLI